MAAPKVDPADTLRRNRRAALDLAEKVGGKKVLALLQDSAAELSERLRAAKLGAGRDSFTATKLNVSLLQVKDVTRVLAGRMKGLLVEQAEKAADDAAGHLLDYMGRAERSFRGTAAQGLRLKEASVFDRAKEGARASVLRRIATSGEPDAAPETFEEVPAKMGVLQRYGVETVEAFEEAMQRSMVTGASWAEARDALIAESPFLEGQPKFWAERLVRTETMGSYNRAGWEAVRAADDELGDMCKILSAVFDDRTGWDSYQVHGQIRLPDQAFEWDGGAYMTPPNRPNDREVVVPHRIAWPLPPYLKWRSDAEVLAAYARQRKTGSPGARPNMTTVPLNKFGR